MSDQSVTPAIGSLPLVPHRPNQKTPLMGPNTKVGVKTERALIALASGIARTQTAAAKIAGMTRQSLQSNLGKPHVQARLDQLLRSAIRSDAVAAQNTIRYLAKSSKSEYVRLEASKDTLDRAGYSSDALAAVARNSGVKITIDLG